ncbi:hypothetical protein Tco_0611366 [Tanacetum coccineum]
MLQMRPEMFKGLFEPRLQETLQLFNATTHTKIINRTIGDDQIDSGIIYYSPNGNVNSGSIEKDTHVPDLCLELYKERVPVLENINGDNNYLNEFLEADKRAKHFSQQAQSQFVRDRDIIRDLEKQRDKLDLDVKDYKRKNEELQKTHSILKRQMSENEDRYHDTVLDLEAKLKKNVDLILKLGNSLQGMFMLGPKPLSVYDQQLKHGLGYPNPYTLKQAISQCPKLYLASSLGNSEISLNVRDTEDTLDDASKSQQKVYEKMNDPIAVANKQNCWTIDYAQINALYKDFVPQKELSAEQKYFPSSFIPSDKNSNATPSIPASMPSESPLIIELDKIKNGFQKLSELIQKNCKRASIFYTSPEEIQLNDFCQDQLKPIVNELQFYFEFFESTESELCELEKQNDFLKDQLFEVSLKHEVELSVLLNHECVDNSPHAEIEQLKKKSTEIQEGLQARINILEKDVQRFLSRKSFDTLADYLQEVMVESLPIMVDTHIKEQVKKQVPEQVRDQVPVYVAKGLILERQKTKEEMKWMIAKAILQEHGNIQAEISSQIQKAIDNRIPSQVDASVNENEQAPSTLGNQEQEDDYDFWTESYASTDDEIPMKQKSQDIIEEVSLTIDEAKLKKIVDEMLRQIYTSGDEHQYHIDQMKNFLKSDIVWESRKEILVSSHSQKTTPLVQSCQKDPEAPPLSLINQDLLYLKKGSLGPKKIVLSLHKFLAIIFNDDDIEEQTSRWVNKCVKKFNPYA